MGDVPGVRGLARVRDSDCGQGTRQGLRLGSKKYIALYTSAPACAFSSAEGNGTKEEKLLDTGTRQSCEDQVRSARPAADGVTWRPVFRVPASCPASFGKRDGVCAAGAAGAITWPKKTAEECRAKCAAEGLPGCCESVCMDVEGWKDQVGRSCKDYASSWVGRIHSDGGSVSPISATAAQTSMTI